MACAFGIRFQSARNNRVFERFLDSENNWFERKKAFLHAHGLCERIQVVLVRDGHEVQQGAPVHRATAGEVAWPRVEQAQFVGGDQDEPGFIQAASPRASEHLEDLIGTKRLLDGIAAVRFAGESNAAQGKIDAGCKTHGGHDDAKLACFRERFDDTGPCGVAEPAVMIRNPVLEQTRQVFTGGELLFGAELERVWSG